MKRYWFALGLYGVLALFGLTLVKFRQLSDNHGLRLERAHDGSPIQVRAAPGQPSTVSVWEIAVPPLRDVYAITGEVRYRDIPTAGYLEMQDTIAGKTSWAARTNVDFGLAKHLLGTSGWRKFRTLVSGGNPNTEKVGLSVVLPQGGEVELRRLELVSYVNQSFDDVLQNRDWWTDNEGLRIALLIVMAHGALATVAAALGGWKPVLSYWIFLGLAAAGGGQVGLGLTAFALRQPHGVWFPFVLVGLISFAVFGLVARSSARARHDEEMRRMVALDAGG